MISEHENGEELLAPLNPDLWTRVYNRAIPMPPAPWSREGSLPPEFGTVQGEAAHGAEILPLTYRWITGIPAGIMININELIAVHRWGGAAPAHPRQLLCGQVGDERRTCKAH